MKSILIDDLRNLKEDHISVLAPEGLIVSRNSRDALNAIRSTPEGFYAMFLDHDLGIVESIGIDSINPVIDYLCEQAFNGSPVPVDTIFIHTSNPVGAKQMLASLTRYGYNAVKVNASDYFTV